MDTTEPHPTEPPPTGRGGGRSMGMVVALLAGVMAALLCAGLVVQIEYRPDGWSGMYADVPRAGFHGPYGSYPVSPDLPASSPGGYRVGAASHAEYTQLFGGLRIDIDTSASGADLAAVRLANGTRYWQYHRNGADQLVAVAGDVQRTDLFVVWRPSVPGTQTLRLERIDVRAGRMRWRQELRVSDRTLAKRPPQVVTSASGVTAFLWADLFIGLDRVSGEHRWTYHAPAGCVALSGAAVEGGTLVTGLGCGTSPGVAGIDMATGVQRWLWPPAVAQTPTSSPRPVPTRRSPHPTRSSKPTKAPHSGKPSAEGYPPRRNSVPALALRSTTEESPTSPRTSNGNPGNSVAPSTSTMPSQWPLLTTTTPQPPKRPSPTPTPTPTTPTPSSPTPTPSKSFDALRVAPLGDGRVALPDIGRRPIIDVATGRIVALLGPWEANVVPDGTFLYVLLKHAIGIDDLRSGRRVAAVALPPSIQGPLRLLAAQDGVLLLATTNGQITLLPSTVSPQGQ